MKLLLIIFFFCTLGEAYSHNQKDTLEIVNIKSSINGGTYQLYIRTPQNYSNQQRSPAILLLDANYYHRTFVNLYDSMVNPENDNQVIIGIGYLPNPMNDTLFMRDFTPSFIDGYPNSGKADQFKQVLETELIPTILENYSIDKSRLSIVGHHYSALFLTWLLTQERPKFSNYVICSPVLVFSEDFTDFKIDNQDNAGIYLSSGSSKIKFVDDLELNESKFTDLSKELANRMNKSNAIETSFFESTLRYDDLYKGFFSGISYILENPENEGVWSNSLNAAPNIIRSKSEVIIDQIIDSHTSNKYEVTTCVPQNTKADKLPSVVILDADFNYTELLYASQQLINEGDIPKSIVVGIGYGTTIIGKGNHRNRDLLPYEMRNLESGNGNNFAVLLNKQLITYLSQYPIDENKMTLEGHSYGGLFLAYLLTRDDLAYQNLIISSPAIWQGKSVLKELKKTDARITQNIFIASGELNDNDKDAKQLGKVLKGKTDAKLKTVFYPKDNHLTVISKAFKDGLRFIKQ